MGRPSKFGEKTTAIRVPESKIPLIQEALETGFVQNSDADEALLEGLVQQTLERCAAEGLNPQSLLLHLLFRDLVEKLDRFPPPRQREFVALLCERYLCEAR